MRVLFVAPWVPSATRPRSLGILKRLAGQHEVEIVAMAWSKREVEELGRLAPLAQIHVVEGHAIAGAVRAALALPKRASLQQAFVGRAAGRVIAEIAARRPFDLAVFNVIRSAHLAAYVPAGVPKLLDLDEYRSAYYAQLKSTGRSAVWRLIAASEFNRMARAERRAVAEFDRYFVSSPTDLSHEGSVQLLRSEPVISASAGSWSPGADPEVVFVGRLSYRANVEAIEWFVQSVWPRVLRRVPTARLTIVGADPGRRVHRLRSESVRIEANVPEVSPFYARARVSVIPVTMATGVQMKLIESLAVGVPTVATPVVAQGAGLLGDECVVAGTADEWVESVCGLLTDDERCQALSAAGAAWFAGTYAEQRLWSAFDHTVAELLDQVAPRERA